MGAHTILASHLRAHSCGHQARDDVAEIKRARLRDAIERGYEDASAGKVIRLGNNDEIDALFADL